ncbi:hypothetical protein RSAG8_03006, partial [Rhizoctonia solani AG-8 WAC10335]
MFRQSLKAHFNVLLRVTWVIGGSAFENFICMIIVTNIKPWQTRSVRPHDWKLPPRHPLRDRKSILKILLLVPLGARWHPGELTPNPI